MKNLLKYPLISISILYFLFRFPNLTKLPIFTDEGIYLDWAWRMTHVSGFLYYSLYDAKQPFVMWLFGIFATFFPDPLFAGRFVTLLLGLLSAFGLYRLGELFYNRKVGFIAAITYTIIPIFVMYDRQALMESAITATSIWGLFFIIKSLSEERSVKHEVFAGITLGLGFFSKSTAALFLITTITMFSLNYFKSKNPTYLQRLFTILCIFAVTTSLLLMNPQYWQTLQTNSRYILTLHEFFSFPFPLWLRTILGIAQIAFVYLTPPIIILAFIGIKNIKNNHRTTLLLWMGIPMIIALLTVRTVSQRYIVSLLPLFALLFAFYFAKKVKNKITYWGLLIFSLLVPIVASLFLIYNHDAYFLTLKKISPFSEETYIKGQISGYGVKDAIEYLRQKSIQKPIIVTYAENSGNPESTLSVYFAKYNIMNGYFELRYLQPSIGDAKCIELLNGNDLYFVSRDEQLVGFESFVTKERSFKKPYDNGSIGVYKFKKGCPNPFKVNPVFHGR